MIITAYSVRQCLRFFAQTAWGELFASLHVLMLVCGIYYKTWGRGNIGFGEGLPSASIRPPIMRVDLLRCGPDLDMVFL